MSNTIWETLKHTQNLEEIKQEETYDSDLEFFLTPPQNPKEAIRKNVEYDCSCIEECNKQKFVWFLVTHDKIVSQLLNPVWGWQTIHTKPPKTKSKETEVHHPLEFQIGTLLLGGPKRSCTSSIKSWPTFKYLGQGPVLHKLKPYAND